MLATEHPLICAVFASAMVDPVVIATKDGRIRVHGLDNMVRRTAEQEYPRPELGPDEALDILHLISKSGVADAIGFA